MIESLRLMPGHGTHQLADVLVQLLRAEQQGQINGMIFAVSLKGSDRVYCDAVGRLHRDRLKALGASLVLQQHLAGDVHQVMVDSVF